MKNIKAILLTAIITTALFGAVVFSACTKVSCSSIICQHGGACSKGVCSCPTGWGGTFCDVAAITYIKYANNAFTPVTIQTTAGESVIPVGGTFTISGANGTVLTGTATTSAAASELGITTDGGIIGNPINWDINNTFPVSDTLIVPLNVGSTYFFLRMTNKSSHDVINYYVNYQFPYGQWYQDVTVPANGVTYDLGYYLAYPNSNVQTQSSNTAIYWTAVSLPFTTNQLYTVTVN